MIKYRLNGKTVTRDEFLKNKRGIDFKTGIVRTQCAGTWPMYSDAMGVHPDQAKEAYSESIKMGVPTSFDNQGRAIFNSAGHRKAYCEAYGVYDRNGGYGDPQRK